MTMVEVLQPSLDRIGQRGGQNRLRVEDQLLMTLQYGGTKSKVLRQVRSSFRTADTDRNLRLWVPFVLVGNWL
ncbi:hypothetical protein IQ235_12955 [Oscillatoriales cyanobacterium LEGE 11467]|uniref:Uncharacterized protein n=1 Tax=Zarconia navalis LEGE 11467 TaxID=1828826 RepID=A0A928W1S5_9CYAN|nr:hypothetical protein [Zarconia navalis]MBE9041690.1 hypothetical protein [Zarconia navalis LEGE 11467]